MPTFLSIIDEQKKQQGPKWSFRKKLVVIVAGAFAATMLLEIVLWAIRAYKASQTPALLLLGIALLVLLIIVLMLVLLWRQKRAAEEAQENQESERPESEPEKEEEESAAPASSSSSRSPFSLLAPPTTTTATAVAATATPPPPDTEKKSGSTIKGWMFYALIFISGVVISQLLGYYLFTHHHKDSKPSITSDNDRASARANQKPTPTPEPEKAASTENKNEGGGAAKPEPSPTPAKNEAKTPVAVVAKADPKETPEAPATNSKPPAPPQVPNCPTVIPGQGQQVNAVGSCTLVLIGREDVTVNFPTDWDGGYNWTTINKPTDCQEGVTIKGHVYQDHPCHEALDVKERNVKALSIHLSSPAWVRFTPSQEGRTNGTQ